MAANKLGGGDNGNNTMARAIRFAYARSQAPRSISIWFVADLIHERRSADNWLPGFTCSRPVVVVVVVAVTGWLVAG